MGASEAGGGRLTKNNTCACWRPVRYESERKSTCDGYGIRESGEGDGGGVCRKLTTVSATGQRDRSILEFILTS